MEIICKKKISIPKIIPPVAGENPCKGQDENSKWLEQFILMHETINLIYYEQVKFLRIKRDFTRFVLYSYYTVLALFTTTIATFLQLLINILYIHGQKV